MMKGRGTRAWVLVAVLALVIAVTGWPGRQQAAFSQELLEGGPVTHLKIATYNIHRGVGTDGSLDLDKTIATLKETGAEIIGLQEVERYSPRSGFVDQAKRIAEGLGMEVRFEAGLKIWPFEFGNALLSKYPISGVERIDLPSARENRVGLLATLDVHGHDVQVLVTHLGLKGQERTEHVQAIAAKLGALAHPLVMIGDFNTTGNGPEMAPLFNSLRQTADAPLVTFPELSEQIDHILVSDHFAVHDLTTLPSTASDHLPLLADLSIKRFE